METHYNELLGRPGGIDDVSWATEIFGQEHAAELTAKNAELINEFAALEGVSVEWFTGDVVFISHEMSEDQLREFVRNIMTTTAQRLAEFGASL